MFASALAPECCNAPPRQETVRTELNSAATTLEVIHGPLYVTYADRTQLLSAVYANIIQSFTYANVYARYNFRIISC